MSANTPTAFSSYDRDELTQIIEQQAEQIEQQAEQIDELIEQNQHQQAEIDELKEQIEQETDRRSAEIEGCHSRISGLEQDIEGSKGGESDDKTDSQQPETALERICALPEHVVDDNLTQNQKRARSVARRIDEYGKKVPAGIAVTSSRIKRVLTAQEDKKIHRQTVSRVADFLKRFGDSDVEVTETRSGETTVVFDEQLVDRVTAVVTETEPNTVTPAVI
jgi:chromosome segregation ATPase